MTLGPTIVLSVAHNPNGSDAATVVHEGRIITETELSRSLCRCVAEASTITPFLPAVVDLPLADSIQYVNNHRPIAALEFHFDMGAAAHSTVFYSPHATPPTIRLAHKITASTAVISPWRVFNHPAQRPFIAHRRLTWCEDTKVPALLVEVGFLDNPEHLRWLLAADNMQRYALGIALGLWVWLADEGNRTDG